MLELKKIIAILQQNLKFVVILTLLGGLAGFGYAHFSPSAFEAQNTVYVKREAEETSGSFYNYDGFYTQQVSKEYTDTVVGLLKTIDLYLETVERMGQGSNAQELQVSTKVKKISPQVVSITVTKRQQEEAKNTLNALTSTLVEKIRSLNKSGDKKISIETLKATPYVSLFRPNPIVTLSLGFLSGLLVALTSLALGRYFR